MLFFWWIIALILFPLLFLPFLPLKIVLELNRNKPDDYLDFQIISRFYFLKYEKRLPLKECKRFLSKQTKRNDWNFSGTETGNMFDDFELFYLSFQDFSSLLPKGCNLLKDTYWEKFKFNLSFGTGNPVYTGILNGVIWTIMPIILNCYLSNIGYWKSTPILCINPYFEGKKFSLKINCIFYLPLGHLIDIGTSLLYIKLRKRWKKILDRRR